MLTPLQPARLFEGFVPGARLPLRCELKVSYPDGNVFTLPDPYAFTPTPGNLALHLAGGGSWDDSPFARPAASRREAATG